MILYFLKLIYGTITYVFTHWNIYSLCLLLCNAMGKMIAAHWIFY